MAKILIADDALYVRRNMTQILTSSGHELFEAKNGKEAIEIYQEVLPDLVIMNIVMPVLDGISAVREIRKINSDAKIIMCSAMGQQKKLQMLSRQGLPISLQSLIKKDKSWKQSIKYLLPIKKYGSPVK